ncbi:MAG: metallopeptidase TldD-related protein [Candidatus Aminicenantes bacterium]|jgi:hypothetical protein
MDKIERKISYASYKRELIFNSTGSFSHLDVLFGSCTEGPDFFLSKEDPVRGDIMGKLRQCNYLQEIKDNPGINNFFLDTIKELLKENINPGIFLVQKNEYIEVISGQVAKNDLRDFMAGRIVMINEKGNAIYRDVDCRSKNKDAKVTDILISNFKKAAVELRSRIKNAPTSRQFDLNSASTIVFSPGTAGFLIHEVFGHLLEADLIVNKASVFGEKKLGEKIAVEGLNIIDDVSGYENYIGLNKLDDEGEDLKPIHLVRNGILSGFISNSFLNEKINCKEADS